MNVFREAGHEFFNEMEQFQPSRKRAIENLDTIQQICTLGIDSFYKPITGHMKPDVFVKRECPSLVLIQFTPRELGFGRIGPGPSAAIFVTRDGTTIASRLSGWLPDHIGPSEQKATTINPETQDDDLSSWLLSFLKEYEMEYRGLCH